MKVDTECSPSGTSLQDKVKAWWKEAASDDRVSSRSLMTKGLSHFSKGCLSPSASSSSNNHHHPPSSLRSLLGGAPGKNTTTPKTNNNKHIRPTKSLFAKSSSKKRKHSDVVWNTTQEKNNDETTMNAGDDSSSSTSSMVSHPSSSVANTAGAGAGSGTTITDLLLNSRDRVKRLKKLRKDSKKFFVEDASNAAAADGTGSSNNGYDVIPSSITLQKKQANSRDRLTTKGERQGEDGDVDVRMGKSHLYPVGTRVRKYFEGYGWFNGFVIRSHRQEALGTNDEMNVVYRIKYEDDDEEELYEYEMEEVIRAEDGRAAGMTNKLPVTNSLEANRKKLYNMLKGIQVPMTTNTPFHSSVVVTPAMSGEQLEDKQNTLKHATDMAEDEDEGEIEWTDENEKIETPVIFDDDDEKQGIQVSRMAMLQTDAGVDETSGSAVSSLRNMNEGKKEEEVSKSTTRTNDVVPCATNPLSDLSVVKDGVDETIPIENQPKENIPKKYPIGTRVKKYFHGYGWFFGKVVSYQCSTKSTDDSGVMYKVRYEDDDEEELEECEMDHLVFLAPEKGQFFLNLRKVRHPVGVPILKQPAIDRLNTRDNNKAGKSGQIISNEPSYKIVFDDETVEEFAFGDPEVDKMVEAGMRIDTIFIHPIGTKVKHICEYTGTSLTGRIISINTRDYTSYKVKYTNGECEDFDIGSSKLDEIVKIAAAHHAGAVATCRSGKKHRP